MVNIYLPLRFFVVNDGFSLYHQIIEYSPTDQISNIWRICQLSIMFHALAPQEIRCSMKTFSVALQVPVLPGSHIFEASTSDKVILMGMNQSFKTFDDFIVRKSKAGHVQAQHLGNHLPKVHQLEYQTET